MIRNEFRKVLFESWLRNMIAVKRGDSFVFLTVDDAEKKLKDLIESGKFADAAIIAEQLHNQSSLNQSFLNEKLKRTSIRVSLATYIKIVQEALKNDVSVSKIVEDLLIEDVERALDSLSRREDVDRNKIVQLRNLLSKFSDENINGALQKNTSAIFRRYSAREEYYISVDLPESWISLAAEAVEEMQEDFIEDYVSKIEEEILRKYLEITYREDIYKMNILNDEKPLITLRDGDLILEFGIHTFPHVSDKTTKDRMTEEVGHEAVKKFEDVVGQWVLEEGTGLNYEKIFFEAKIKVEGDKILFSPNYPIEDPKFYTLEDLKKMIDQLYEDEIKGLKEEVLKSLENRDFERVKKKTKSLAKMDKVKKRVDFTIEELYKLAHKTQVITFSLPECLLYVWQTYGTTDIDKLLDQKK